MGNSFLIFYHTITTQCDKPFENIVGKGENAGSKIFLISM